MHPVLAIHAGDMHLHAAWLDAPNSSVRLEDKDDPQKLVTPSLFALRAGGASFGIEAQWAIRSFPASIPWQFHRACLLGKQPPQNDDQGRRLTAAAFIALSARRLTQLTAAWLKAPPLIAVSVPNSLPEETLRYLSVLVSETTDCPCIVVPESQALVAYNPALAADGITLFIQQDDDALRLWMNGGDCTLKSRDIPSMGLCAIRQLWMQNWNHDAAIAVSGVSLFDGSHCPDLETIWQDLWRYVNAKPHLKPKLPRWTAVRQSRLFPLVLTPVGAQRLILELAEKISMHVRQFLDDCPLETSGIGKVVSIGQAGVNRELQKLLKTQPVLEKTPIFQADTAAFALGCASRAATLHGVQPALLTHAPFTLGVMGTSTEKSGAIFKQLVSKGEPLPAKATIALAVNPDKQRLLTVALARVETSTEPEVVHQSEFGPMQGQGLLKIQVTVVWEGTGRFRLLAFDASTYASLVLLDCSEIYCGEKVVGASHLKAFE